LYDYVLDDPINAIDSLGLETTVYYLIRDSGPHPFANKAGVKCCTHTCYYSTNPNDTYAPIPPPKKLSDIPKLRDMVKRIQTINSCEIPCGAILYNDDGVNDYKIQTPQGATPARG
jgi:hypothetical protein